MITFFVPGEPVGKGRPRVFVNKRTGRAHGVTPGKTRTYEGIVRTMAMEAMKGNPPWESGVNLELKFLFAIPQSWPDWKIRLAKLGAVLPTTNPDWDNASKAVVDACNGVVWRDDAQIVRVRVAKEYTSGTPGVHVSTIQDCNNLPAQIKKRPKEEK